MLRNYVKIDLNMLSVTSVNFCYTTWHLITDDGIISNVIAKNAILKWSVGINQVMSLVNGVRFFLFSRAYNDI